MSSTPDHTAQLARDLRAARHDFDDVSVSGDAWQQNQRRVAADRGRRARVVLVAAAAVVLIALVGGAVLLGGGPGGSDGMPASGDDPFGDSVVLGPPVTVETLDVDGVQTAHEVVLSDTTGKGPSLCDRYVAGAGSAGGCTSRDPRADDPGVAIDWLSGTTGSGDIRGVLAGVDSRVLKVQIWMDNGDETLAVLKPGGWEGTKLFGFTVPADGPRPQRLVAYSDASGTVLQSVDLGDLFGRGWLPRGGQTCSGAFAAAWPQPGSGGTGDVTVELWSGSAKVIVTGSDTVATGCISLQRTVQGVTSGPRDVVVLVAPEVAMLTVQDPAGGIATTTQPTALQGSLWKVAALHLDRDIPSSAVVLARDASDHVLQRVPVGELR